VSALAKYSLIAFAHIVPVLEGKKYEAASACSEIGFQQPTKRMLVAVSSNTRVNFFITDGIRSKVEIWKHGNMEKRRSLFYNFSIFPFFYIFPSIFQSAFYINFLAFFFAKTS
jgi:hypothetical protein